VSPTHTASNIPENTQSSPSSKKTPKTKQASVDNVEAPADPTISEKTAKAYEFLKNDNENKLTQVR